jgi:hypothetical protein
MATPEQIDRILTACKEIVAVPLDQMVANAPKWGLYTFEGARRDLALIISLATHLSTLPIDLLPDGTAGEFGNSAGRANTTLTKLKAFDPLKGNPNDVIQQIISETKAAAENLLVTTQSWIPFLAYQRGDVQRNIIALTEAVTSAQQILDQSRSKSSETKKEIDEIVVAAREASASAGVGVFTSDFAGQATALKAEAKNWLIVTGGFGAFTLITAAATGIWGLESAASNPHVLQFMTSKLVLLVVLLTATIWCGRIYKATMHQAATNNHRANALKTFQAFIKAATAEQTRDAVLLETTRSIFSLSPTGYLETSEPAMDTGTKVLEIFKNSKS